MSVTIPERLADLLERKTKAIAFLALVKSDGTPQVTPIWFDYDGEYFIFNTARGQGERSHYAPPPSGSFRHPRSAGPLPLYPGHGAGGGGDRSWRIRPDQRS